MHRLDKILSRAETYLCPAEAPEVIIELDAFEYTVPPGRTHFYRAPEDPTYIDKWRARNVNAIYEPFRARLVCRVEKVIPESEYDPMADEVARLEDARIANKVKQEQGL